MLIRWADCVEWRVGVLSRDLQEGRNATKQQNWALDPSVSALGRTIVRYVL